VSDGSLLAGGGGGGYDTDGSVDGSTSVKSVRPTPAQLAALGLRDGANDIVFEAQNGERMSANLFLWGPHARIVVSDIDGTITKSDVRGHLYNLVGMDWTHAGVAQLYTNIAANGYHIMYLTSRAIGQMDATKGYLHKVSQGSSTSVGSGASGGGGSAGGSGGGAPVVRAAAAAPAAAPTTSAPAAGGASAAAATPGGATAAASSTSGGGGGSDGKGGVSPAAWAPSTPVFKLPPGPVITSPDRLLAAFHREVVQREPHKFKIAALSDIAHLFPHGSHPFYAGFGNRDTDIKSYRAVHVAESKIFIINPEGDIKHLNRYYRSSYASINALVHAMFPPISETAITHAHVGARLGKPVPLNEVYGDAQYWKPGLRSVPEHVLAGITPKVTVLPMPGVKLPKAAPPPPAPRTTGGSAAAVAGAGAGGTSASASAAPAAAAAAAAPVRRSRVAAVAQRRRQQTRRATARGRLPSLWRPVAPMPLPALHRPCRRRTLQTPSACRIPPALASACSRACECLAINSDRGTCTSTHT